MQTYEKTYYFSLTSGEKKHRFLKSKELLTEPTKTTKLALGFDVDVIQNLKLTGSINKFKHGDK